MAKLTSKQVSVTIAVLGILAVAGLLGRGHVRSWNAASLFHRQSLPENVASWQQYDGIWEGEHGVFSDLKGGRGDKAFAGSPAWGDYTFDADIRFDSDRNFEWGDAGVVVRASNAAIGTDSYNGYYIGLRLRDQTLVFSRSENEYMQLATAPLSEPLTIGVWYHVHVRAQGCAFAMSVSAPEKQELGKLSYTDKGCVFQTGQVGMRSYSVQSSWKDLRVEQLP